ncbi:MAG: hypothetical protein WBP93_00955 [Pyrinomonadaceae bacterium]
MSEDTTKDISSKYDTKPTLEQVLDRINALGLELHKELQEIRSEVKEELQGIRSEVKEQLREMKERLDGFELRFDKLDDKIDVLNGDVLSLRADARRDRRGLGGTATKQDEGTPASDTP